MVWSRILLQNQSILYYWRAKTHKTINTPIAGGYNDYDKIQTQLDMYGAPAPTLDASSSLNISKKTIDRRSDLFNEIIYSE